VHVGCGGGTAVCAAEYATSRNAGCRSRISATVPASTTRPSAIKVHAIEIDERREAVDRRRCIPDELGARVVKREKFCRFDAIDPDAARPLRVLVDH